MQDLIQIERMNGKPVYEVPAKSVVNFKSGFEHKLLCDGLTFTAGTACGYSCTFCYVDDMMRKSPHLKDVRERYAKDFPDLKPARHADVVIRRKDALNALRSVLSPRGKAKFLADPADTRVLYMSALVDVAANRELCDETIEACKLILSMTHWQIRILSKSNMLPRIAEALDNWDGADQHRPKARVIYGVSTGTLDDDLAQSFELGTPLVKKRIESLNWLQDHGYRTYGMICPSLPCASLAEYRQFSQSICKAIRVDECEHVWAEIMNVRGESFTRTAEALMAAGYDQKAALLKQAAEDDDFWEQYSRDTFVAHAEFVPPGKLRFLQYVGAGTRNFWQAQESLGAVLLK